MTATLAIEGLSIAYSQPQGEIVAVRDASLTVSTAECVGLVGESGSGKTQMCMAALGLLPANARTSGSIRFEGEEMLGAAPALLNRVRGSKLTMVFQDPLSSLTPHLRIGLQLAEVLVHHAQMSWRDAERGALRVLERVRVPEPRRRLRQFPHELSGGMRQRVMIGMSLLCEPSLLIADEPTSALDVTVQAHIIDLLRAMRDESRVAILLISHDLALVAGLADRIVVMYGGRVVECGPTARIMQSAAHPYTALLLKCATDLTGPRRDRMPSLAGQTQSSRDEGGCAFAPRCPQAAARCWIERPALSGDATADQVACHYPLSS